MKLNSILVLTLGFLALSCNNSEKSTPVLPGSWGDSRALAVYTMTLSPAVITDFQARNSQADHDVHLDLVPKGSSFPAEEWFFDLDAALVDFDRGADVLTVDFTVKNHPVSTIYDPRLVFYFDYYDDPNGFFNEPGDPYQLSTADFLFNIDKETGNPLTEGPFFPAMRVMTDSSDSPPYPMLPGTERAITAKIRIPSEYDPNYENYEPIQWDILIEGTMNPTDWPPHAEPIDILNPCVVGILEQGETVRKADVKCILRPSRPISPLQADSVFRVWADLGDFHPYNDWVIMDINTASSDELNLLYHLDGQLIDASTTPARALPYNIRIKVEMLNGSPWMIEDDAYAYVVPEQDDPDDDTEKHAGKYWVVFLEEYPATGRYEFCAMNTVKRNRFWLSGDEGVVSDNLEGTVESLDDYTDFRHLSMARLGEPASPDNTNYRLVFEAKDIDPSVPVAGSKADLDILGLYLDFSTLPPTGHFRKIADGTYQNGTQSAIEREPQISPDGHYVVYEREERVHSDSTGLDYDRTRAYVVSFNPQDPGYPAIDAPVPFPEPWNPADILLATSTEPTIGYSTSNGYIVAYATDVVPISGTNTFKPGRGAICLTRLDLDLIENSAVSLQFEGPLGGITSMYLHSPYLAPDATYLSLVCSRFGFPRAWGIEANPAFGAGAAWTSGNPAQFDARELFHYNPIVSESVDVINDSDWDGQHRIVYRSGNNKNGDIRLYFTDNVPPGLPGNLNTVSDQDLQEDTEDDPWQPDPWRDDRGHDSAADISDDGCAIVWTSERYSSGDIYFLDLRELVRTNPEPDYWNQVLLASVVRLTTTGQVAEPQISDFIPLDEP